jgi:Mitochondrial carrier protein
VRWSVHRLASAHKEEEHVPDASRGPATIERGVPCRRQIQLQSATRVPARQVIRNVLAAEGVAGFYRGFVPNAAKNLPNKGEE